jgi:hypothetical protein
MLNGAPMAYIVDYYVTFSAEAASTVHYPRPSTLWLNLNIPQPRPFLLPGTSMLGIILCTYVKLQLPQPLCKGGYWQLAI